MLPPQQPSMRGGGSLSWRAPLNHYSSSSQPFVGRVPTSSRPAAFVRAVASSPPSASSSPSVVAPTSSPVPAATQLTSSSTQPITNSTPVTPPNSIAGGDAPYGGMHTTIRAILEHLHQQLQTSLHTFKTDTPVGRFTTKAITSFCERVLWLVNHITNGTESSMDAGIRLVVVGIALLLCGRFAVCHVRRCLRGNKKNRETTATQSIVVDEPEVVVVDPELQDDIVIGGRRRRGGGGVGSPGSDSGVVSGDDGGDTCSASPCRKITSILSPPSSGGIPVAVLEGRRDSSYHTPARGGVDDQANHRASSSSPSSPEQPTTPVHFIPQGVSAAFYSLFVSPTSTATSTPPPPPSNSHKNGVFNVVGDDITSENEFEVVEREGYIETYDVRAEREKRRLESEKERRLSERYGNADEHVERLIASYSGSSMPPITDDGGDNNNNKNNGDDADA